MSASWASSENPAPAHAELHTRDMARPVQIKYTGPYPTAVVVIGGVQQGITRNEPFYVSADIGERLLENPEFVRVAPAPAKKAEDDKAGTPTTTKESDN